ncbi:MAG TPA: ABC transporter substrate-binding protein, partial [Candidatus Binatia bacterium]|nr:ABC transporter substrate-binding protein [Candidatus Binatia bacterium]
FSSSVSHVVAPLAEEAGIPHIAIASDPALAAGKYTFVHWTPPAAEAALWTAEAQRRGVHRIAAIILNQQGATAIFDEVKARLGNMRLVHESRFDAGETDFRTMLLKAKESSPDLYLVGAFSPELEMLAKQARELNVTPLSTIESFEFTPQPELFEGYWYVNAADPTDEFRERYESRFGAAPTPGAANAYDAARLLALSTGSIDELHAIRDFPGALGNLTIDAEGIVWSKPVVRQIVNGKPVTMNPYQSG